MKLTQSSNDPLNILIGRERNKGLYEVIFDHRQVTPRVSVGSAWIATDRRYNRKFLLRAVDLGYHGDFDVERVVDTIRFNPLQEFDERSLEYYCSEKAWMRLEGELVDGRLASTRDQPTILQTFLSPLSPEDERAVAAADVQHGFYVGHLRSGARTLSSGVTLQDRFNGFRTLITGASGYGKSTLVRDICRYWLSKTDYGKLIDDLKCEYIDDIKDERGRTVYGLHHHPDARTNLYLFTPWPRKFEGSALQGAVAGIRPLRFRLEDIPPAALRDIATHLTEPQRLFLEMYQDQKDLFSLLMQRDADGEISTSGWHKAFKAFIVYTKEAKAKFEKDKGLLQDESTAVSLTDIMPSSYLPIHGVIKQLERLARAAYVATNNQPSCLDEIMMLLKSGKTVILDKSGLEDEDRMIISTVLANRLYRHNASHSSGPASEQAKVVPFTYLVEEAHLLLSRERVREGSIFVNFAKTGRSFQIGLVPVTQRPSSIDSNILSQCDNFITLRLTLEDDVRDLVKASGGAFVGYDAEITSLDRGAGVVAFGEPRKVQSVQFFDWTVDRARTRIDSDGEAAAQGPADASHPQQASTEPNEARGRPQLWAISEE